MIHDFAIVGHPVAFPERGLPLPTEPDTVRPKSPRPRKRAVPITDIPEVVPAPVAAQPPEPPPAPRSGTDMTDEAIETMLKAAYT